MRFFFFLPFALDVPAAVVTRRKVAQEVFVSPLSSCGACLYPYREEGFATSLSIVHREVLSRVPTKCWQDVGNLSRMDSCAEVKNRILVPEREFRDILFEFRLRTDRFAAHCNPPAEII